MLIFVSNNLIICILPVRDRPRVEELSPFLSAVTLIVLKSCFIFEKINENSMDFETHLYIIVTCLSIPQKHSANF